MTAAPTSLLLQDLISAPSKAESILECLTADQINMIEGTINRIKRRKMDKSQLPSPVASPPTVSQDVETSPSAAAIANALAAAMVSAALQAPATSPVKSAQPAAIVTPFKTVTNNTTNTVTAPVTSNDPIAEIKDGVEWVSFVYSHNRTLKRYSIRTDIQKVVLEAVDEKFKAENCVYPRANLPKETYKGNRWSYETECNDLGWKLAWLNKSEIAGKRGLIQRAVDSYRNRYPSMRSRRVARQEKLLNGTLRKRKNREEDEESISTASTNSSASSSAVIHQQPTTLEAATVKPAHQPKTIAIDDLMTNTRYRIKINVETISLDEISTEFRKQNCPFPRAYNNPDPEQYVGGRPRWVEDTLCNELCWKLAYLNPRVLAGKKNLLQRALDTYRSKFMPTLQPRKHSSRAPPAKVIPTTIIEQDQLMKMMPPNMPTPLTVSALSAQNALFDQKKKYKKSKKNTPNKLSKVDSPDMSCVSGTNTSLDFGDCFSLDEEVSTTSSGTPGLSLTSLPRQVDQDPMISPSYDSMYSEARFSPFEESISCHTSSSANSIACTPSPPVTADFFGFADVDIYDSFMLPPINNTFMLLDNDSEMKSTYGPLMSPCLQPSSTQQDLVKLEEDFQDNFTSAHLLDPLF